MNGIIINLTEATASNINFIKSILDSKKGAISCFKKNQIGEIAHGDVHCLATGIE